jgi:hypothetical protein
MTRNQLNYIMPVIQAILDGKRVQIFDSMEIVGPFERGCWKDTDNWGLLRTLDYYRIVEDDGSYTYFGNPTFHGRMHYDEKIIHG